MRFEDKDIEDKTKQIDELNLITLSFEINKSCGILIYVDGELQCNVNQYEVYWYLAGLLTGLTKANKKILEKLKTIDNEIDDYGDMIADGDKLEKIIRELEEVK